MAIYTVHVPGDTADHVTRADGTKFVREGFSASGFVFGLVFLLWHRLWIAAAGWIALAVVLGAVCSVLHLPTAAFVMLALLMHLFVGVEGNDLRRWGLERRGLPCVDIVSGGARDDAELVFFHRPPPSPRSALRTASVPMMPNTTPAVIGMFPDAGP